MPALIIGGLVVLVIVGIVWARVSAARSDRRSMETYGRALGVLGDVARRTGPSASVRVLPRSEAGRAHVRTDVPERPDEKQGDASQQGGAGSPTTGRPRAVGSTGSTRQPGPGSTSAGSGSASVGPVSAGSGSASVGPVSAGSGSGDRSALRRAGAPPQSVRPASRPSTSIPVPERERERERERELSFEDRGAEWAGAGERGLREPGERQVGRARRPGEPVKAPPTREPVGAISARDRTEDGDEVDVDRRPEAHSHAVSPDELRRQAAVRRLWTASAAGLALLLIVVAAIRLAGNATPNANPPAKSQHHHTPSSSTPTTRATTTTAKSSVLKPVSTVNGWVTYRVPSKTYTLTFTAQGGNCWVGVETGPGSGVLLWSQTVQPGVPMTYKAPGPVAVEFGAIAYISVTMNGLAARFPTNASTNGLSFVTG